MNRTHNLFSIAAMMHGGEENLAVSNDPRQLLANAASVAKDEVIANAGKPMTEEQRRAMFAGAKGIGGGGNRGGVGVGGGAGSGHKAPAPTKPTNFRKSPDVEKWRDDYKKGKNPSGTVLISGKPYLNLGNGNYAPLNPDDAVMVPGHLPGIPGAIDGRAGLPIGAPEAVAPVAPITAEPAPQNPAPGAGEISRPPSLVPFDPSMPQLMTAGGAAPAESPYALAKRAAAEGSTKTPHSKADLKDPNASKVGLKIPGSEKNPTDPTPKGGWFINPQQPSPIAQPVPVKPRPVISVKPKPKTVLPVRMTSPHMTFSKSTISGGTMTSDYKINSLRDAFHRWQKK